MHLESDPIGLSGGGNSFAYTGGSPLGKIDPLGLYNEDVHDYLTFFIALELGMTQADAQMTAMATQYIDDNPSTGPLGYNSQDTQTNILKRYHFVLWTATGTGLYDYTYSTDPSIGDPLAKRQQLRNLRSYALPYLGKLVCPYPSNQSLLFMGELLHAFQDTFSHRDRDNVPISINEGAGHVIYGHNPDYTYNHMGYVPARRMWNNNESRTLAMEQATYNQIQFFLQNSGFYASGKANQQNAVSFSAVQSTLIQFNQNQTDYTKYLNNPNASSKLQILTNYLGANGVKGFNWNNWNYIHGIACQNRKANLSGLSSSNYSAAILGQGC